MQLAVQLPMLPFLALTMFLGGALLVLVTRGDFLRALGIMFSIWGAGGMLILTLWRLFGGDVP